MNDMKKYVNCFVPYVDKAQVEQTVNGLKEASAVNKIYLLATDKSVGSVEGCEIIHIDSLKSSATIKKIATFATEKYSLIYTKESTLVLGLFALERMVKIAQDTSAAMIYANHFQIAKGVKKQAPVISYQKGSLRDDFNFGSLLFYNSEALKAAAESMDS